jgi:L-aspartate oxidase
VRSAEGLRRLLEHLADVPDVPDVPCTGPSLSLAAVEATDLHTVSTLVAASGLHREESRGCHRRSDHPGQRREWAHRVTWRLDGDRLRPAVMPRQAAA